MSKIISLDFDGVLSQYKTWIDAATIPDDPVPGAQAFVAALIAAGMEPVVFSTRCTEEDGRRAVVAWLAKHGFPDELGVWTGPGKPMAAVTIDDRAITFTGPPWPSVKDIANFKPWNR